MDPRSEGVPSAPADLRWYFSRTETGPLRSNFGGMVTRLAMGRARSDHLPGRDDDDWLEAASRAGEIGRVLRALDPETVDTLWRAFAGDWPNESALLGEFAGLAPKTVSAMQAYKLMGRKRAKFHEWLRELFDEQDSPRAIPTLQRIAREAKGLRGHALAAFVAMRRKVGRHAR